jgi:NAD-dependent dihydropyrimidine dehydrogenase PreA subunit
MYSHRIVLHFPADITQEPLICQLAKDHDISFTVLRAEIAKDTGGMMVLGLQGQGAAVRESLEFLEGKGVRIEPLQQDIRIDPEKCTHCGACVGQCPTDALSVDAETRHVEFDSEQCIACQACVPACPYAAIFVAFV